MKTKNLVASSVFAMLIFSSSTPWACGGEESGKHIGNVLKVQQSSFTIRDAETNRPITFNASTEILNNIKSSNGRVVVNYEENEDGALKALSIAF